MGRIRITHKKIDRIRLSGKMENVDKAWDYCQKHGYRTVWAGPMPIAKYKVDPARFLIIAEKEVSP